MVRRFDAVRRAFYFVFVRFAVFDQFFDRVPRRVFAYDDDRGFEQVIADRNDRIFRKGAVRLDGKRTEGRQIDKADRVAVGL